MESESRSNDQSNIFLNDLERGVNIINNAINEYGFDIKDVVISKYDNQIHLFIDSDKLRTRLPQVTL